jgi:hypothetical protein
MTLRDQESASERGSVSAARGAKKARGVTRASRDSLGHYDSVLNASGCRSGTSESSLRHEMCSGNAGSEFGGREEDDAAAMGWMAAGGRYE